MIPQMLSTAHILIIAVVVLVLFGGTKLAGLGKASGQAIREFKEELSGSDATASVPQPGQTTVQPPAVTQTPSTQQ